MASPSCLLRPVRDLALRQRPQLLKRKLAPVAQRRFASDNQKTSFVPPGTKGPNEDQLPHVSEERAAIDKSMGETPPDIDQGTPVKDVLKRDQDAQKNAPQVIKDQMKPKDGAGQKRSYSTTARRLAIEAQVADQDSLIMENGMIAGVEYPDAGPGHKFPLPDLSELSRLDHLKQRYDPVVDQLTKSLMRDGKLSAAQKRMAEILNFLRTAPPAQPNPAFPQRTLLLSDSSTPVAIQNSKQPPTSQSVSRPAHLSDPFSNTLTSLPRSVLPLYPVEYLTTIIDSVSPLIKIRQQKGLAGGGASLPIPVPLGVRQRRRTAIQWILDAADGRREIKFSERVAKELLKVADGTSSVWERRAMVHRLGVSSRSNIRSAMTARRR